MPHVPTRTCVGCRQAAPARDLVRLGARDGQVVVAASRPVGRGAWLHPRPDCAATAVKARAFARAFKRPVSAPDTQQLLAALLAARTGS